MGFRQKIKVDPESWCKKIPVKQVREKKTLHLRAISMFILQVPPSSLIHKRATAEKTLYRTLSLHIYGGGNIHLVRDMEKPGCSDHFYKGQDAHHGSSECPPALN